MNPECECEALGERRKMGTWLSDKGLNGCYRETTQKASLSRTQVLCPDFYLEREFREAEVIIHSSKSNRGNTMAKTKTNNLAMRSKKPEPSGGEAKMDYLKWGNCTSFIQQMFIKGLPARHREFSSEQTDKIPCCQ